MATAVVLPLTLLSIAGAPVLARNPSPKCPNPGSAWVGTIRSGQSTLDLAIDADGNVVTAGLFAGTLDFDLTEGVDEHPSYDNSTDGFITKVNSDGSYAWTYTVGGPGWDSVKGVAAGTDGVVLIAGVFAETVDFDPGPGADERTAVGDFNAFVTGIRSDGEYLWTLTFGQGTDRVGTRRVALDRDKNMLIVGSFYGSADFDPTEEMDIHGSPSWGIFVSKFGLDGSYHWTHVFSGPGNETASGIAVDPDDNVLVTGIFRGTLDFDPGPGVDNHTAIGPIGDTFITKLRPDGSYAWTRTYAVHSDGSDRTMTVDSGGNVYLTGGFTGTVNFDPTDRVDLRTSVDESRDIFVTSINAGGKYRWTWTVGAPGTQASRGVAVDDDWNVLLAGGFWETVDFDPGPGVDVRTVVGADDAFVTKINADLSYAWTATMGGPLNDHARHIGLDGIGAVIVTGSFNAALGAVDLDPSCEVAERKPHDIGSSDTFITKLVCIEPTADFDGDGDVDLRDFAALQNCFTGEAPTECGDGCSLLDLDPDDDIDLTDFADFQTQLIGP